MMVNLLLDPRVRIMRRLLQRGRGGKKVGAGEVGRVRRRRRRRRGGSVRKRRRRRRRKRRKIIVKKVDV